MSYSMLSPTAESLVVRSRKFNCDPEPRNGTIENPEIISILNEGLMSLSVGKRTSI